MSRLPKKCLAITALIALAASFCFAQNSARFNSLGHKMICSCGCNQILLECNHVGCPRSDGMRNELTAAIQRGDSDGLILQAFVQKYGPTILAAPTATGFDRVAWVMPFVVLLLGFGAAIFVIRSWKRHPQQAAPSAQTVDAYREKIRREVEL